MSLPQPPPPPPSHPGLVDRALDRLQLRRAPGRPTQLHLSVTDRCFLPCLHCDIYKNKTPDLPGHHWADLIDRLAPWCAPAGMNFVGGEPLLRKDLEALMAQAVGKGFTVSFNTNGWLLTEARAAAIAAAGVTTGYVSLDGATPATVDHSRGKVGSYEKARAAIARLRAAGLPQVAVACILHGQNATEIPALLALCRDEGLGLVVQPLYQSFGEKPYDPNWWAESPLFPREEAQLAAVFTALDQLSADHLRGGPTINAVAQLQAMKLHFQHPSRDNRLLCRAGHSDLSFDPHGNIRLCYFLPPIGTIFDPEPLALLWDGPTALRRRWEVSRCDRRCNLLNCNFDGD